MENNYDDHTVCKECYFYKLCEKADALLEQEEDRCDDYYASGGCGYSKELREMEAQHIHDLFARLEEEGYWE